MRLPGHVRLNRLTGLTVIAARLSSFPARLCRFVALCAVAAPVLCAQNAPYVLPYTMSTYVGGNAYSVSAGTNTLASSMTVGQVCYKGATLPASGNAAGIFALDTTGDGCLAANAEAGTEPHDVRVDGIGNLFFIDNTSTSAAIIHRVSPFTLLETAYVGGNVSTKSCYSATSNSSINSSLGVATKIGDDCPATDGVANSGNTNATYTTDLTHGPRGLGLSANGDLNWAGYNDYVDHKVSASTGYMTILIGGGSVNAGTPAAPTEYAQTDGAIAASTEYQSRGISGADANGNVYVADTGDNVIRKVTAAGIVSTISAANPSQATAAASIANGTPLASTQFYKPEDVQLDSYGNLYIADNGNGVIRAVWFGKGTLIGYQPSALTVGYVYNIAGFAYQYSASTYGNIVFPSAPTYSTRGVSSTFSPTSVLFAGPRKISFDSHNNLYIADSGTSTVGATGQPPNNTNVIWFVDAVTGQMRILAGSYNQAPSTTPTYICTPAQGANDVVGDGCPATLASLYPSASVGDLASSPDTQGNLYITDAENGTGQGYGRIRKALSGLNFPAVTLGSGSTATTPVTQNILIHFAPSDTPATTNAFTLTTNGDYTAGTPYCIVQNDLTDDCLLPVTFTPTIAGTDSAILTVASSKNGNATFQLTGTGVAPSLAFDPGNIAQPSGTFNNSRAIALDGAGNAYIADTGSNRILFYNAANNSTTVFAGGAASACANATDSFGDGCAATSAVLKAPQGVTLDTYGNVFIADTGNNIIRKVTAGTGIITLYAGNGTPCPSYLDTVIDALGDGCTGTQTTFKSPTGLTADNLGNIYVADTGNDVIRIIASNGNVSLLGGIIGNPTTTACTSGNTDTFGDGCSAVTNTFNAPTGLAYDPIGKFILVADTGNNDVRKIYLGTTYGEGSAPGTCSGSGSKACNIVINPVSLVAGAGGQAGSTIGSGNVAINSQLTAPTGVAVDAAENVYIADAGNDAVRMVTSNGGLITTVVGINATSGDTPAGGAATATQLNTPAAVAVGLNGTLYVADSGNNRLLTDTRDAVSFNFGRVNPNNSSAVQNFTEVNTGGVTAALPSGGINQTTTSTQFTLTGVASSNGAFAACASGNFLPGAICNLQGQFNPTITGPQFATYTQASTGAPVVPTITLSGEGAILTTTTLSLAQTAPASGAPQFGGLFTVQATVAPTSCNPQAATCYPTGAVTFTVDGTPLAPVQTTASGSNAIASVNIPGLSVGPHTIGCSYGTDGFYNGGTCPTLNISIAQAFTKSVLTAAPNNQVQFPTNNCFTGTKAGVTTCIATLLTASVVSTTVGQPTGTITFLSNGAAIGTATANSSGVASLQLTYSVDAYGNLSNVDANNSATTNFTLPPGTYTLSCSYGGASNYAASTCAGVSYTVLPQVQALNIRTCGVIVSSIYAPGTNTPQLSLCPSASAVTSPTVATAQGSTTDATLFVFASNTVSGTLSFSCSGLPANAACTFQPTTLTVTPSTNYPTAVYTDMTLFTDVQPGNVSANRSPFPHGNTSLALMIGWPLSLCGLLGMVGLRRKTRRSLSLLPMLLLMVGATLTFTGCAGPGNYSPALTPTGSYPITVTVSNGTVKTTAIVNFTVTGPGITGQE